MSVDDRFPLTAGQVQHYRIVRENPALRTAIWSSYRISGTLDVDRFIDSVESLVSRHEALRVQVVEEPGGELCQWVRESPDRKDLMSIQKVVSRSEDQFERYVRHVAAGEKGKEWRPDSYHFRFRLLRYHRTVHALLAGFSHLATDGIGADILMRDLRRMYQDPAEGRAAAGRPRLRFVESAARQAAARAKRSRRRVVPPSSAVPPLTQFDLPGPGPGQDGRHSRQAVFSVTGGELAELRRLVSLHGCTEFQWILAAFTATVFRFTRQDRLKVAVPVNLRTAAERDVVGMYVLSIPVLVDRPGSPEDLPVFPKTVGTALIRAVTAYQKADPEAVDESMAKAAEKWGARFRQDLSVNYTKSPFPSRTPAEPGWSEYEPQVDYSIRGAGLRIFSHPDSLHFQAVMNAATFSDTGADAVLGDLREKIMTPATGWVDSVPERTESEIVDIRDPSGSVIVSASLRDTEEALLGHPSVRTATVVRETRKSAETYLRAVVEVHGEATEESFREYLMELGSRSPWTLAPAEISILRAGRADSKEELG